MENHPDQLTKDQILQMQLDLESLQNHPQNHFVSKAVKHFVSAAIESKRLIYGQINIEDENRREGVNTLISCFPSGDCFFWFIAYGYFSLICLVDEKWKTVCLVPASEREEFLGILNQASNGLNIKNGYPVQNPDQFTPIPTGRNENSADAENA